MSRTQIYFGPPGTGKTTTLLSRVDTWLSKGGAPDKVAFFSFSRQAVREAVTKACDRFKLTPDDFPWFRTIHSTAFKQLQLTRADVLQDAHVQELGQRLGLPLSPRGRRASDEWDVHGVEPATVGDRCLLLYHLSRARGTSLEHEWQQALLPDTPWHLVADVATYYERYKKMHGLLDFDDMLDMAQGTLPVDLLIMDEAQDSSKAQWNFVRRAGRDVPSICLAGDDDQAIYGWAGAETGMLLRIAGEHAVLPQSYRLPRVVKNLADGVSSRIQYREPKTFAPRDSDGTFTVIRDPERINLRDGKSWLLLARSHYGLLALRQVARSQGVVYSLPDGRWSWAQPAVQAALGYERMRKGQAIGVGTYRVIRSMSSAPWAEAPAEVDTVPWHVVAPKDFSLERPWFSALDQMNGADLQYIRQLREHGESLSAPGRVRVSTVHAAKGGEADQVLVISDLAARVATAAKHDPDAELRVQYVAMTRAREGVTWVLPRGPLSWAVPGA